MQQDKDCVDFLDQMDFGQLEKIQKQLITSYKESNIKK